jgi:hypothetical protein
VTQRHLNLRGALAEECAQSHQDSRARSATNTPNSSFSETSGARESTFWEEPTPTAESDRGRPPGRTCTFPVRFDGTKTTDFDENSEYLWIRLLNSCDGLRTPRCSTHNQTRHSGPKVRPRLDGSPLAGDPGGWALDSAAGVGPSKVRVSPTIGAGSNGGPRESCE